MITREMVVARILAHLNQELSEQELVAWAEASLVDIFESESDNADEPLLLDVLSYVAAGGTPGFPLSWSVLSQFLERLGTKVRVVASAP